MYLFGIMDITHECTTFSSQDPKETDVHSNKRQEIDLY